MFCQVVIFLVPGWVSCKLQYWGRWEWLRGQKDWRLNAATLHKPRKIVQHYSAEKEITFFVQKYIKLQVIHPFSSLFLQLQNTVLRETIKC